AARQSAVRRPDRRPVLTARSRPAARRYFRQLSIGNRRSTVATEQWDPIACHLLGFRYKRPPLELRCRSSAPMRSRSDGALQPTAELAASASRLDAAPRLGARSSVGPTSGWLASVDH